MSIKEMRMATGLSQNKFATMFDIPVATLKDWEQGRRMPPGYVAHMIETILQYRGLLTRSETLNDRKMRVEKILASLFTATYGPNDRFMEALNAYIEGAITLEEMESKVDRLEYLEG